MGANIVQFNAASSSVPAIPENKVKLRWRIVANRGITVSSAWLPETRLPSLSQTLKEFENNIQALYIDAQEHMTGKKWTHFRIDGGALKRIEFKGMFSTASGFTVVAGFEVEDNDGTVYLILRDGTVTPFTRSEDDK